MHTTILDLQNILATQTPPQIIALTETKHRHIKSTWRHALKGYKLVHNPSLYNKHTKRCSGGAIIATDTNTYINIEPYLIPPHLQHHIAMTLLTPKAGSKLLAISICMPQHNNNQGIKTYKEALQWLTKTLTEDLPNAAVILGGDLQATPSVGHPSYHQALGLFCTCTSLGSLGDPCTPTFTPTNSPLDHWLIRLPTTDRDSVYDHAYTTPIQTTYCDHRAITTSIPQVGNPTPHI